MWHRQPREYEPISNKPHVENFSCASRFGGNQIVTVTMVSCTAATRSRFTPPWAGAGDAAGTSVADRGYATQFTRYTGQSEATSLFTVTYLVDSDRDRTVDNPEPSTVVYLLQAASGQPPTESARG